MKKLIYFFCLIFLISCMSNGNHIHRHQYKEKIHCYKVLSNHNDGLIYYYSNDWIYYYVILMNNNSCYYATSSTPISNFSKLNWESAKENPIKEIKGEEELPEEEINSGELSETIQEEMNTNPSEFDEATPETSVDAESSTDASESDAGGDSGGGDSGGDGGGD